MAASGPGFFFTFMIRTTDAPLLPQNHLYEKKLPAEKRHIRAPSSQTMQAIPSESTAEINMFDEKENAIMSTKNTNQLNVPEARAAMDKFKMEAASDLAVAIPS